MGFVIGKTARAAAVTFAAYAAPSGWERPVAIVAVVLLAAVNYQGISRTAGLTRILVVGVTLAPGIAVAACSGEATPDAGRILDGGFLAHGWYGILQSAGYARITTMGEEVRNPRRAIREQS